MTHEEADVIIAPQVVRLAGTWHTNIRVLADDAYVLCCFYMFSHAEGP